MFYSWLGLKLSYTGYCRFKSLNKEKILTFFGKKTYEIRDRAILYSLIFKEKINNIVKLKKLFKRNVVWKWFPCLVKERKENENEHEAKKNLGSESGSFYPRSSRSDYVRSTTLQIVIQFFLSVNHSRFKVASFYTALLGITDPLLLKIFPVSATTRSAPMALFYSRHNLMKLKPYTGAHTYIMSLKKHYWHLS